MTERCSSLVHVASGGHHLYTIAAPSCCIPPSYCHLSATLQTMSITVANLQYNRAVFRIFITLLRFSFDSLTYVPFLGANKNEKCAFESCILLLVVTIRNSKWQVISPIYDSTSMEVSVSSGGWDFFAERKLSASLNFIGWMTWFMLLRHRQFSWLPIWADPSVWIYWLGCLCYWVLYNDQWPR